MLTDIRALLFELCEFRTLHSDSDLGLQFPTSVIETDDAVSIYESKKRSDIVIREFKEAGLYIKTQYISSSKSDEINVIGSLKGKEKEEIIICAHHDKIPDTAGADDNASGLLTLITLAYSLREKYDNNLRKTVKLISFGGEEAYDRVSRRRRNNLGALVSRRRGILGSRRYVRYYDTSHIWGVINLDLCGREEELSMVGRDNVGTGIYDLEFAGIIRRIAYPLGIKIDNAVTVKSRSDNRPFAEKGIRTVWLTRVNPKTKKWTIYHSNQDLPETINLDYILENKRLLEGIVDYFMQN